MAPVITLNSNYSLTADQHQWIIMENGRMIKFFMKIENVVDWVFRAKIRDCNIKSLEQLGFQIKRYSEALQQVVTSSKFRDEIRKVEEER